MYRFFPAFFPRAFLGCLFCWLAGCNVPAENNRLKPAEKLTDSAEACLYLKNADLVVRADDDLIALSLRNMNDSDKTYSHSGLAFFEDSRWYVYHMMAGEENPSMEMRRDPIAFFIDRKQKSGYGIYRYQLVQKEVDSMHAIIKSQYNRRLRFDTSFNLKNDSTMYCSEMIAEDLYRVSGGAISIPVTMKANFFFKARGGGPQPKRDITYIAIDNLYLNKWCRLIFSKQYE